MDELGLRQEFEAAEAAMKRQHFDRLRQLGIERASIFKAGGIGVARITKHGRTYTPNPHGEPVFILGCWWPAAPGLYSGIPYPEAHLDDLIAFGRDGWWYRSGERSQVLGPDRLAEAVAGDHVPLAPSPLAWLQGGCIGYCPLALLEEQFVTAGQRLLEESLELYSSTTWRSSAEGAAA